MFTTSPLLGTSMMVPQNAYNHDLRAVLWLFSPQIFSVQARRPLVYNFDSTFTNLASQAITQMPRIGSQNAINQVMASPGAMQALIPSSQAMNVVDLSSFADSWTFILMTQAAPRQGPVSALSPNALYRTVYYGYFFGDEPINPLTNTPNPNAIMILTHKTVVSVHNHYGDTGMVPRIKTMADIDIIDPMRMSLISPEQLQLQMPGSLFDNLDLGPTGQGFHMIGESSSLSQSTSPISIDGTLYIPQDNLRHVVGAIGNAVDSFQAGQERGSQTGMHMEMFGNQDITSLISANLKRAQGHGHGMHTELKEGDTISLPLVLQRFDPEIQPVIIPKQAMYSAVDQRAVSMANIFQSLLMTMVPPLLADASLAHAMFQYDSYGGGLGEQWKFQDVAGLMPMSNDLLQAKANAVINTMRNGVFAIMKTSHGDFNLQANITVGGISQVILNFYSDSLRITDAYEAPTILGGFGSALVGNTAIAAHNATELSRFVGEITGSNHFEYPPLAPGMAEQINQGLTLVNPQTGGLTYVEPEAPTQPGQTGFSYF